MKNVTIPIIFFPEDGDLYSPNIGLPFTLENVKDLITDIEDLNFFYICTEEKFLIHILFDKDNIEIKMDNGVEIKCKFSELLLKSLNLEKKYIIEYIKNLDQKTLDYISDFSKENYKESIHKNPDLFMNNIDELIVLTTIFIEIVNEKVLSLFYQNPFTEKITDFNSFNKKSSFIKDIILKHKN